MALSGMHPLVLRAMAELRRLAQVYRVPYTVTSTYRSTVLQRRLYLAWLARGKSGLPAARPGLSIHEYGFAFDAVSPRQQDLVTLAEAIGFRWAGPGDPVHFGALSFAEWQAALRAAGLLGTGGG